MYAAWILLRLALLAGVVVYFVLYIITARRLHGRKVRRSTDIVFWAVVALAMIRVFARFTPLSGLTYRLILVLPGIAAGVGIPGLMSELTRLKADIGEPADANPERVRAPKLN